MQRTNIFLTDEQQKRLSRRAREQGMSKSGLIRQILDEALAISRTPMSPEEAIKITSGIWSDRRDVELEEVLSWRHEAPLERLQ